MAPTWTEVRQLAHRDILAYMALMRPSSKFGKHHELFRDIISDVAARRKRFICLSAPPRHSKSYTFSQALPAWWLGNAPTEQVIATSYAASLAQSFGGAVRADMGSELYGRIFSADSQPGGRGSSGTDFQTAAGGKYKATGVGGSLTGFGGDLIIVDDPVKNAEQADSPRYIEMLNKFFSETLWTRLMPGGCVIVMATRWRESDLIGHILRNFTEFEYVNLPAIVEEQDLRGDCDVLGRRLGDALWPEFFTIDDLQRTRRILGELPFQALYQGRPSSAKGSTLAATDLRWATSEQLTEQPVRRLWSWDTALTKTQQSDYTVGTLWHELSDGSYCLVDYVRMRGNFTDVLAAVEQRANGCTVLVEHSHMGLALRDSLPSGADVQLFQPRQHGDKLARLQATLPLWKAGRVLLASLGDRSDYAECVDELLKALLTAHDDFLDSVTQALLWLPKQPLVASTSFEAKARSEIATGAKRKPGRQSLRWN